MTTPALLPAPSAPANVTPTPTPTLDCSDCITPTPAVEVHALGGDDYTAYCRRCADTHRRYAVATYPVADALSRGIQVTL
jgi:hypothetical protein